MIAANVTVIVMQYQQDSRHHAPSFATSDLLSPPSLLIMLLTGLLLLFLLRWLSPYFCQNVCKAVKAWQCLLLLVLLFVRLLLYACP